ncbi:hypothetical protein ACA910_004293 [Epithemia clementina (nom. ined.)]
MLQAKLEQLGHCYDPFATSPSANMDLEDTSTVEAQSHTYSMAMDPDLIDCFVHLPPFGNISLPLSYEACLHKPGCRVASKANERAPELRWKTVCTCSKLNLLFSAPRTTLEYLPTYGKAAGYHPMVPSAPWPSRDQLNLFVYTFIIPSYAATATTSSRVVMLANGTSTLSGDMENYLLGKPSMRLGKK